MSYRKQKSGYQKRLLKQQSILATKKLKGSMESHIEAWKTRTKVQETSLQDDIACRSSSGVKSEETQIENVNSHLSESNDGIINKEEMKNDEISDKEIQNEKTKNDEVSDKEIQNEKMKKNDIGNEIKDDEKMKKNEIANEVKDDEKMKENEIANEVKDDEKMKENEIANEVKDDENEKMKNDGVSTLPEIFSQDLGLWPSVITEEMREYFTHHKPCQFISEIHNSSKFCYDKTRCLTEFNFYRMKKNKEKIKREWLVYSPTKNAVYCYICKLFSSSSQALCNEGYSNWKNITERLSEHENSKTHRDSVCKLSLRAEARIDSKIIEEYKKECAYWRSVLNRVVCVIKFLAERGLPLFGDDENIGSLKNGNFLGCLELLSKFDPLIAEHLEKYGNQGKGNVNYLSSTIVTELLQLMSDKVLNHILSEINESKYYGLILDSTPDITHTDQLSFVLRYVNKEGEPIERFIKFLPMNSHKAESLTNIVFNELQCLNLDVLNCRGQSYDNASNMAGQYSGLQARIKTVCPLAEYVPCAAHSLNLVGTNAVQCCHQAVSFFGIVQNIYNFFSSSTQRWNLLQEQLKKINLRLTVKPLSNTRWSAEADATKVLRKAYLLIKQTLQSISENENIIPSARHEAKSLYSKMNKLETALMTIIWDTILQRINSVNKSFQNESFNISSIVPLYRSLIEFINTVRENFCEYEEEAQKLVDSEVTYSNERKKTVSKRLDKLHQNETTFNGREAFKIMSHFVICDSIIMHLNKRMDAYINIEKRFGFLYGYSPISAEEIKKCAKEFQCMYSDDIDEHFPEEFIHFRNFAKDHTSPEECLKRIRSLNITHTFPNVDSALHILLTLPISNCSSERSFSVLKRIKNRLRSCVSQENLQAFSLLTIENSLTSQLDFNDVIDEFALRKGRKKPF